MRILVTKTRMTKILVLLILIFAVAVDTATANNITRLETVFDTDFVSAGIGGMRGTGTGTITLNGVSGIVTKAYLYWQGPTNSSSPAANASVLLNGTPIVGTNIGFSSDNCWGFSNSQAYRADVTSLVRNIGNGSYDLLGFTKPGGVDVNGASLIVFFDDGNESNDRDVVLFDGNDSNINNSFDAPGWNITLPGINYASGSVTMQLHVSDGQQFLDAAVRINNTVLVPAGPIFQGSLGPSTQNGGSLWDITGFAVTSFLSPGPNTLSLTTGVNSDCLSLVVAVIDLPSGAAPCNRGGPVRVEPITGFPSCGPAAKLTPIWGSFGRKSVLTSDSGEKLELECMASGINFYALFYTPSQGSRLMVGVCPFSGGCNSAYFTHSGDSNNDGRPDCIGRTFWKSKDYGQNDIPNPWTGEIDEIPIRLDHAISILDAASKNLTKKDYKFRYAVSPPLTGFCTINPNPRPEGNLVGRILIDPPIGPETEAFFNTVVQLLQTVPGPHEPMEENPVSLADLNGDGNKDQSDFQIFQNAFGSCFGESRYNADADLDEDECITFSDFQVWIQFFNPPTSNDTIPPTVTSPTDVTKANDPGLCSALVNPGTATATDNLDSQVNPIGLRSDGRALSQPFPVGTTTITWIATDSAGNSAFSTQTIEIRDVEGLTITNVSATPSELWPPNHQMVDITINYAVTGNCDPASPTTTSLTITSNEPVNGTGDGDTAPDWEIVDAHHVRLRAERAGNGNGRVYTITITARDNKGNSSSKVVTVSVPRNRGNG